MNPRLTVIVPVYNAMPHLQEAVESILRQTYCDFTFIIVNDGSTDGSGDYLGSLSDPRVLLISQANQGQGAARKAALRRCKSEFVALMDADDISLPDRFLLQVEYLDAHPDVVILGSQFEFLVEGTAKRALKAPLGHEEIEAQLLRGRAGMCNSSLMFRTGIAVACWDYPNGQLGEDIDLCLSMCEQGRAANLNAVLVQYRLHTSQTSLARCKEIISANCYAAYRAVCRRKAQQMPALDAYRRNASLLDRLRWSTDASTLIQYRTGMIQIATGKPIRGLLRLALLGFCRPGLTVNRVAQSIGALVRGRAG